MRSRIAAAALAILAAAALAPTAHAHQGDPNFSSTVTSIGPRADGIEAEVVNHDDSLSLRVEEGATVEVQGYEGEPYIRFLPDGTVQVNRRSPATYLNEDRYGEVSLPGSADDNAAPEWETVASNGTFQWHDHRIHWMARTTPPQVEDTSKRTKVFDWKVPIAVDGRPAAIAGELFWEPSDSGFPVGAIAALAAVALAALALVVFVRRRRARGNRLDERDEEREAW